MAGIRNFATAPANIMPGLQALTGAVESYGQFQRDKAKRGKVEQLKQQASRLIGQDPDIIAKEVAKNPELRELMKNAMGAENDAMFNMSKQYLIEQQDPFELHAAEAERDIIEGRDPSGNIEMSRAMLSDKTRSEATKMHETVLLLNDPKAYKAYMAQQGEGSTSEIKVGSQEWLEDGTLLQSTPQGPRVYSPDQRLLKGKEAADAIARGRAEKVSNLRKAAGEKRTASLEAEEKLKGLVAADVINKTDAAKISTLAYKRLEGIYTNIDNLNEGIALLRQDGANTGVIDKYLPSLKKSTLKLKNLQGRLGLDILRNTTFGSLSAQELRFALDTAFPEGLQPEDAAKWLEDRMNAQEKLADYIESAAMYLGTPGNTIKGYLEMKRNEQGKKKVNQVEKPKTNIKFLGFE